MYLSAHRRFVYVSAILAACIGVEIIYQYLTHYPWDDLMFKVIVGGAFSGCFLSLFVIVGNALFEKLLLKLGLIVKD